MAENIFTATTDQQMRDNIRASWNRADVECRREGRAWYAEAHDLAADLADATGLTVDTVTAIMAVLSPRSAWPTNVMNTAATLVEAGHLDANRAIDILRSHGYEPKDGVWRMDAPRGLGSSIAKARRIAETENPVGIGYGQKTLSFWSNLSDPKFSNDVTIDAWAAGVTIGRRLSTAEMGGLTPAQYRRVADQYRAVAKELRMRAHVLQAACWCEIRGRSR